jgi:creatine kinase
MKARRAAAVLSSGVLAAFGVRSVYCDTQRQKVKAFPGLDPPSSGMPQYTGGYPMLGAKHKSFMAQVLTPQLFNRYKDLQTSLGCTLEQCIKTGVDTPHLGIGITAGDEECYDTFKDIFYPVIKMWHGFDPATDTHKRDLNPDHLVFDEDTKYLFNIFVKSTRIRAARSLKGHYLTSSATDEDRKAVETKLANIFENHFTGEMKGTYYPLGSITDAQKKDLRSNGFLFQLPKNTNCLYFSGAASSWPDGRGIFHNDDKTFLAWVNEEDHCRIISMSTDGDVLDVFKRFAKASDTFEKHADIMFADHLGYIGTCASNLGTGLRASVMVVLPNFNEDVHLLEKCCSKLKLQPRGSSGEHSKAIGGKFDISNMQRIGFSEVQLVQKMINGVKQLIYWEMMLANGKRDQVEKELAAHPGQ